MLGLILASVWLLIDVLGALREPMLLAAAIAALTYPIVYEPLEKILGKPLGKLPESVQAQVLSAASTVLLILALILPVILILFSATGSIGALIDMVVGVVKKDPVQVNQLLDKLTSQLQALHRMYPKLPMPIEEIRNYVANYIDGFQNFAPSFMAFLVKGSSNIVATFVITVISMVFFFAHGPKVFHSLLDRTPLSETDVARFSSIHRRLILRLLTDTVATAVIKGILLGGIIALITGFNFFLLVILSSFVLLLPVVGSTILWLPMSSLLWSRGDVISAIILAVGCLAANYLVDWGRGKIAKQIHDRSTLMSFLLFFAILGGLLTYGFKGMIMGPVALILTTELTSFWLPLYRVEDGETSPVEEMLDD